ncbi:hypothetical protein JCM10207_002491 [Rhodosporidiobolus poonsookiae]
MASPSLSFVAGDLNVVVSGRVVAQAEPGKIDGLVLELDEQGIKVKHPALVSIQTKPESQTLFSINTGEPLLTLATPLIPPSTGNDTFEDDDDDEEAAPGKHATQITLHEGLLHASSTEELKASPLFSSTFQILIDGPSFPSPHFDPSSIVPPTPSVKPYTFDPSNPPASASQAAFAGGVLNSPTLQRALLSPLLSPQRRASSQAGSDASVPPLSLGLSRTSRPSFSGDRPSAPKPPPTGLLALIPSLVPGAVSEAVAATPSFAAVPTTPASSAPAPSLQQTLTTSLSSAAKRAAEEILALRRSHDVFVRRAKAELEVLEARIEEYRASGQADEGVVRGFKTREDRERAKKEKEDASQSQTQARASGSGSGSRDRGGEAERGRGRGPARENGANGSASGSRSRGRTERGTSTARPGYGVLEEGGRSPHRPSPQRAQAAPSSRERQQHPPASASASAQTPKLKATDLDEDLSSRMRAEDEREEDERGRSRSRVRRGSEDERRSRSRNKAQGMAEATQRAVEGAREKSASRDRSKAEEARGRAGPEEQREGGRRGTPRKGENIPATLREEDETETPGDEPVSSAAGHSTPSGVLSPTPTHPPALPPVNPSSLLSPPQPLQTSRSGGATPTFIPSSKALLAVPEEDEMSLPPSRTESPALAQSENGFEGREEREGDGEEELEDEPFEMDEDVDVEALELPTSATIRPGERSPATVELEGDYSPSRPAPAPQPSQSFKPGSFQRASALSASYAALLSSSTARQSSPVSPSVSAVHSFASSSPNLSASAAAIETNPDALPPFSPPDVKSPATTSAKEDAQVALSASVLERNYGAGAPRGGKTPGPDARTVRQGEQKIRDVLAMDVPSHRPRAGYRRASISHSGQGQGGGRATPGGSSAEDGEDDDQDSDDREGADQFGEGDLTRSTASLRIGHNRDHASPSPSSTAASRFAVGSLPIALGRPSTVNAALSSWRPDPERLWAQEREKAQRRGGAPPPSAPPFKPTKSDSNAPQLSTAPAVTESQPLDIGASAPPHAQAGGGGGVASSLARSLRAVPGVGSFSARAEAEQRFEAARTQRGWGEKDRLPPEMEVEEEGREEAEVGASSEDDEDEDEGFVPPHVVAARRENRRGDERWLSRSVARS